MGYRRDPTGWTSRTPQRLLNPIRESSDADTRRLTSPAPRRMMPNASDPLMTPREYNQRETGSETPKTAIVDARTYPNAREDRAAPRALDSKALPHELGITPLFVEQEVFFHEIPVPALHVPIGKDRSEIVDVRSALDRLSSLRQEVSVDVEGQIHVTDPRRVGSRIAIVAELRETANAEEPAIRQEEEVVLCESVHGLPLLGDPSEGRIRLVPGTTDLRLDNREVRVLHFAEHLFDVDDLCLAVLQRLEHALHEVSAELRSEHLKAAGIPHVQRLLEVLDPEIPAIHDARDRDRLHESLPGGEVIRLLEEPHPRHRESHRPVQEVVLHLELELPDAVDERHECGGVHEALELDVERVEDVLARLHREELLHRLRRPVTSPAGLVERRVERQDARHLHVMSQLLDADALLRERDRFESVTIRVRAMDSFDDFLVQSGQGASVELLVHHPVLLDRAEFRRRLRPDDFEGRHELRIRHLVRGPQTVRQVAGRGRRTDDLLREAREAVRLRHDDTQTGHRRLRIVSGPFRCVKDLGHLREVPLLPELPFVRPLLREGLDSVLVDEGHAICCNARRTG